MVGIFGVNYFGFQRWDCVSIATRKSR